MSNGNAVQLAVQLDASDLQIGTEELANICKSVNQSLATIAQLASSTGTWIANTAAKVANTAAQWALLLPGTATENRWTGPPVQRYEKSPDLTVEACVRVTYLPRQSPAKYCQRT